MKSGTKAGQNSLKLLRALSLFLLCSCSSPKTPSASLVSISVVPSSASIPYGSTFQFKASGLYSDGTRSDLTDSVTWSSSNPVLTTAKAVAVSKGLATAAGFGDSTLSASSGYLTGSAQISIVAQQGQLFAADADFGRKFTKIAQALVLPGYGGASRVHPDLIPFPGHPGEILMVYTPEEPSSFENMVLVRSNLSDMVTWKDDLWANPLIKGNSTLTWESGHLADFCLLYIEEAGQKWWTWFAASSTTQNIAYGQSDAGITWSANFPDNPVMTSDGDPAGMYDYHRAPSVLWNRHSRKFEMFYDTLKSDWSVPVRLCRAESVDGKVWTNRQIIYDPLDYGETAHAFHPVVRYFDGRYWCWFPRYNEGLWMMTSTTGLKGDWTRPYPVITSDELAGDGAYRAGVYIDPDTYKMHMMVSHINGPHFDIAYFTSELSPSGKAALASQNYRVVDFDSGGSVIGRLVTVDRIDTKALAATIPLSGTISAPATVKVNGVAATVAGLIWTLPKQPLAPGTNMIKVEATFSDSGYTGTTTVKVDR